MKDGFGELKETVAGMGSAVVCFSGGADSTALMDICRETLGDNAVAFHLSLPMESRRGISSMRAVADHLGFHVEERYIDDRISSLITCNDRDRCYLCKKAIYSEALDLAHALGIRHVLCGDNADDDPIGRPGMRAKDELGIEAPFIDVGVGRAAIEGYVRGLGLPFPIVKDTCLLTRVPFGTSGDEDLLGSIEAIEEAVRGITGVDLVRARYSDGSIRIQTLEEDIQSMVDREAEIRALCKREGFDAEVLRIGYRG